MQDDMFIQDTRYINSNHRGRKTAAATSPQFTTNKNTACAVQPVVLKTVTMPLLSAGDRAGEGVQGHRQGQGINQEVDRRRQELKEKI